MMYRPHPPRKGIYALPNMVTLAALFCSFYAVIMGFNARYEYAVYGLFASAILDGLDGRIARMTGTQSAFGEQMDSLADMVSFGAAPALIAYVWALKPLGRWGWIAAFIYVACTALRLARFNVNAAVIDKRWFQGLPSPAAAAIVMGFIWLAVDSEHRFKLAEYVDVSWLMFALVCFAGLTMVTNLPFYSFKALHIRHSVPFALLILVVLLLALGATYPSLVVFIIFLLYGCSGYALYIWRRYKGEHVSVIATSIDEPDERSLHERNTTE